MFQIRRFVFILGDMNTVLNCRSLDNLLLLMYVQFNSSCAKNI